jgi:hypothetical protein
MEGQFLAPLALWLAVDTLRSAAVRSALVGLATPFRLLTPAVSGLHLEMVKCMHAVMYKQPPRMSGSGRSLVKGSTRMLGSLPEDTGGMPSSAASRLS